MEFLSDAQFTAEFWGWANRVAAGAQILGTALSAIALVVAIWFGLPQLRHIRAEQRRIADELTRRPKLEFGFQDASSGEKRPPLVQRIVFTPNSDGRDSHVEVFLMFASHNIGERTAHHPIWEYRLPGYVFATEEGDPAHDDYLVQHDIAGLRLRVREAFLHPDVWAFHGLKARFPAIEREHEIRGKFVMDDARPVDFILQGVDQSDESELIAGQKRAPLWKERRLQPRLCSAALQDVLRSPRELQPIKSASELLLA